jgi:hypothetical protein
MLFPAIVGRHGVAKSAAITALAAGAVWLMYFVVGWIIKGAVAKELKRRGGRPTNMIKTREDNPRFVAEAPKEKIR